MHKIGKNASTHFALRQQSFNAVNNTHILLASFSIHGGSSVRTYLDCHWITTQVLHIPSLVVPKDTDLIIGYMYQVSITKLYGYCSNLSAYKWDTDCLTLVQIRLSLRKKVVTWAFPNPFISLFIVTLKFLCSPGLNWENFFMFEIGKLLVDLLVLSWNKVPWFSQSCIFQGFEAEK